MTYTLVTANLNYSGVDRLDGSTATNFNRYRWALFGLGFGRRRRFCTNICDPFKEEILDHKYREPGQADPSNDIHQIMPAGGDCFVHYEREKRQIEPA